MSRLIIILLYTFTVPLSLLAQEGGLLVYSVQGTVSINDTRNVCPPNGYILFHPLDRLWVADNSLARVLGPNGSYCDVAGPEIYEYEEVDSCLQPVSGFFKNYFRYCFESMFEKAKRDNTEKLTSGYLFASTILNFPIDSSIIISDTVRFFWGQNISNVPELSYVLEIRKDDLLVNSTKVSGTHVDIDIGRYQEGIYTWAVKELYAKHYFLEKCFFVSDAVTSSEINKSLDVTSRGLLGTEGYYSYRKKMCVYVKVYDHTSYVEAQ